MSFGTIILASQQILLIQAERRLVPDITFIIESTSRDLKLWYSLRHITFFILREYLL